MRERTLDEGRRTLSKAQYAPPSKCLYAAADLICCLGKPPSGWFPSVETAVAVHPAALSAPRPASGLEEQRVSAEPV